MNARRKFCRSRNSRFVSTAPFSTPKAEVNQPMSASCGPTMFQSPSQRSCSIGARASLPTFSSLLRKLSIPVTQSLSTSTRPAAKNSRNATRQVTSSTLLWSVVVSSSSRPKAITFWMDPTSSTKEPYPSKSEHLLWRTCRRPLTSSWKKTSPRRLSYSPGPKRMQSAIDRLRTSIWTSLQTRGPTRFGL